MIVINAYRYQWADQCMVQMLYSAMLSGVMPDWGRKYQSLALSAQITIWYQTW